MFYVHDDHYLVRSVSHSQTCSLQDFFIAVTRRAQHRQALSFYHKPFLCAAVDYGTCYFEAYKNGSKSYKLHVYTCPSTTDEAKMHPVQYVALHNQKRIRTGR